VGEELIRLQGQSASIRALTCFDSSCAFHTCLVSSDDNAANVFDGEMGGLLRTLRGHKNRVTAVAAYREHVGGRDRIATASLDASIIVWDGESGVQVGRACSAKGWPNHHPT
jgi:WD40 repeat protein